MADCFYCCLVSGILLIIAEFCLPGRVIPGALGGLLAVAGFWELSLFRLQPIAILFGLVAITLLLFALLWRFPLALGTLAAAFFALGSILLLRPPNAVHPMVAIAGSTALTITIVLIGRPSFAAHRRKKQPDLYDCAS